MAATTTNSLSIPSSSTLTDTKAAALRQPASASPRCVTLSTLPLPPVPSQDGRVTKTAAYCRKVARNVVAMATGEVTAELTIPQQMETPEILKTIQEAWDKVEDKYAVTSLATAGIIFLCGSFGAVSAIERLPLIPNALELVGIGYTGWFAYKNLVFKPDREALIKKIKDTYKEIIGSS